MCQYPGYMCAGEYRCSPTQGHLEFKAVLTSACICFGVTRWPYEYGCEFGQKGQKKTQLL